MNNHLQGRDDVLVRLTLDSIQSLPSELRESILLVSIPRFFNLKVLKLLLPNNKPNSNKLLNKIKKLPLVQEHSNGNLIVHDTFRMVILDIWKHERHDEFIRINTKLADFYSDSIHQVGTSLLKIEAVYHRIICEEDDGFIWFEKEFLQALEFGQLDYSSAILDMVESLSEELEPNHRLWLIYYKGLLQEKLNKPDKALVYYKNLESQDGWPSETRTFFISKIINLAREVPTSLFPSDSINGGNLHARPDKDILSLEKQIERYKFFLKLLVVGIFTLIIISLIFTLPAYMDLQWLLMHPKKLGLQLCSALIVLGVAWIMVDSDGSRKWVAFGSIVISALIGIIQLL